MRHIGQLAAAAVLGLASCAAQASTVYTSEAAFLAAAGNGLAFQGFESAAAETDTQVDFTGVSFRCTGTAFCPGFFGTSDLVVHDGAQAVLFASPDASTFTFAQAVGAFGIWIGGAGDVGAVNLAAALDNGAAAAALTNYAAPGALTWQYFGIVADTPFTSVTFTPDNDGDGIFFDGLSYRPAAAAVPEPSTALLLGIAGAGLLAARRKRAARG